LISILAVVVTYNPEPALLAHQIECLSEQGVRSVLVDNKSLMDVSGWNASLAIPADDVIQLPENMGIAYAHNAGIAFAKERGLTYVMLMDQDSIPGAGMAALLLQCAESRESRGEKIGAVGPRYFDPRQNNPPPFVTIRGLRLHRFNCEEGSPYVPVDYLISSGSLIPIATLDVVGGMREDLFIDYVDIEWGLRARQKGFQSYGVCAAQMQHSLGDNPVKFFKRSIPIHSPLRHYYHFRNAILLYRSGWLPLNWKVVDGWRLILRYGFYSLYARPRWVHWKMMTLGLLHGLINRSGKYVD
jgi:rhamnosyltransferase